MYSLSYCNDIYIYIMSYIHTGLEIPDYKRIEPFVHRIVCLSEHEGNRVLTSEDVVTESQVIVITIKKG